MESDNKIEAEAKAQKVKLKEELALSGSAGEII